MLADRLDRALTSLVHSFSHWLTLPRLVWGVIVGSYLIGWQLQQPLFYALTAFGLALVLISAVLPWWQMRRVQVQLQATHPVMAGEPLTVTLHWQTASGLQQVAVTETFLGEARRHTLGTVADQTIHPLSIPTTQRGATRVSQLQLHCAAPFGLIGYTRTLTFTPVSLVVLPAPEPLSWLPPLHGRGQTRLQPDHFGSTTRQPDDMASLRDYQPGDPRRHWHQSASARALSIGQAPKVREYATAQPPCWLLVLDIRSDSHVGEEHGNSFEHIIQLAASLIDYAARQQQPLALWADGDTPLRAWSGLSDRPGNGLQQLAWLQPDHHASITYEQSIQDALHAHPNTTSLITIRNQSHPVPLPLLAEAIGHLDILLQEESFLYPVKAYDEGWYPQSERHMQLKTHRSSDFRRLFRAPRPISRKTAPAAKTTTASASDTKEQRA